MSPIAAERSILRLNEMREVLLRSPSSGTRLFGDIFAFDAVDPFDLQI
jgi:hypothetical protein